MSTEAQDFQRLANECENRLLCSITDQLAHQRALVFRMMRLLPAVHALEVARVKPRTLLDRLLGRWPDPPIGNGEAADELNGIIGALDSSIVPSTVDGWLVREIE